MITPSVVLLQSCLMILNKVFAAVFLEHLLQYNTNHFRNVRIEGLLWVQLKRIVDVEVCCVCWKVPNDAIISLPKTKH